MKKVLIALFTAWMLLVPILASASGSYVAGDLTKTAISDSLEQGNQIHYHVTLKGNHTETPTAQMAAFYDLLSRCSIDGTMYAKDGNTVQHIQMDIEDVRFFEATAVQSSEGMISFATNLTGDNVYSFQNEMNSENFTPMDLLYDDSGIRSTDEGFRNLPAMQRLKVTTSEVTLMIVQTVLGWTSANQIDMDGEFYTFDFEYIEPTETRSGVAQRMIGKVTGDQFCALFWDITSIMDWQHPEFQRALADVLAEQGVTRIQARKFTDALFPDIPIDPEVDFVEPSHIIEDDGTLCKYGDISYFLKKATKYIDKLWEESYSTPLELIVSYDDYGEMVGLDAVLPVFTKALPYEGTFTYSTLTDDDWQVLTTSHGELQVDDHTSVIGDYKHLNGEDVNGHNGNTLDADLVVFNQTENSKIGFGINGEWNYDTVDEGTGTYQEKTTGNGMLTLHTGLGDIVGITAQMDGLMSTTGVDFNYTSEIELSVLEQLNIQMSTVMNQETVTEMVLPAGEIIDITVPDKVIMENIKSQISANMVSSFIKLMGNEKIMQDLNVLFGN